MAKTVLSASQQFELRQALHVVTLDALLASRRWAPGDLVFQGGTSLHLAHHSPRFSEDLDFLVDSTLNLDAIGTQMQARMARMPWLPKGTQLEVTKAKDGHNPHAFNVVIRGKDVLGAVRVRVELWQASKEAMRPLRVTVQAVALISGPAAGAQVFVPTADAREIYADKVFAVGARTYLKPRDLFDLDWLMKGSSGLTVDAADMRIRLATYPNEKPETWLAKAIERARALPEQVDMIRADLLLWLPSSYPMSEAAAAGIVANSIDALSRGIEVMQAIAEAPAYGYGDQIADEKRADRQRS